MGMEEALLARLRGAPGLVPLFADRVEWFDRPRIDDDRPRDTLPALTLSPVDAGEAWTHDGPDGLDEPRVRFEIWGRDKAEAMACKRAVIAEMRQPRAVAGSQFYEASLELYRAEIDGAGRMGAQRNTGDPDLFRVTLDFLFFHEETLP